jgi:hypothetical protein
MLAQIGDVLLLFRIYESMYRDHEWLLVALSAAYLDILKFCVHTKEFFLQKNPIYESVSNEVLGLHQLTIEQYLYRSS